MKKRMLVPILGFAMVLSLLTGCRNSEAEPVETISAVAVSSVEEPEEEVVEEPPVEEEAAEEEAEEEEPEEEVLPEGKMRSFLTGEIVDEEYGMKRPFAFMINNIIDAIPQSAISGADIVYEAYVEGNITRLMAVYQDASPYGKIGPLRSARHYYIDYADDYDANYIHFGWSYAAEHKINVEGRTTINGQFYDGSWAFYRTADRVAPHNAYVDGAQLEEIAENVGMKLNYDDSYIPTLHFNLEDTEPTGEDAPVIRLGYLYNLPWFEYNPTEKVYYRYQYGAPHVDMENGEQLKFKNVIVLFQEMSQFNGDPYLKEIDRFGRGTGLYFSDGKVEEIVWEKDTVIAHNRFRNSEGDWLRINPGKTMFQIAPPELAISYSEDGLLDLNTEEAEPSGDF